MSLNSHIGASLFGNLTICLLSISGFYSDSNTWQLSVLIPHIVDMEAPGLSMVDGRHIDIVAQNQVYKLPSHPKELEVYHLGFNDPHCSILDLSHTAALPPTPLVAIAHRRVISF
jgi:hypothetical protein